jgi:hypothetical protein
MAIAEMLAVAVAAVFSIHKFVILHICAVTFVLYNIPLSQPQIVWLASRQLQFSKNFLRLATHARFAFPDLLREHQVVSPYQCEDRTDKP